MESADSKRFSFNGKTIKEALIVLEEDANHKMTHSYALLKKPLESGEKNIKVSKNFDLSQSIKSFYCIGEIKKVGKLFVIEPIVPIQSDWNFKWKMLIEDFTGFSIWKGAGILDDEIFKIGNIIDYNEAGKTIQFVDSNLKQNMNNKVFFSLLGRGEIFLLNPELDEIVTNSLI